MSSEEHRNYFSRKDDFLQDDFQKVWAHFCFEHRAIIDKQETKETFWSPKQDKVTLPETWPKHTLLELLASLTYLSY